MSNYRLNNNLALNFSKLATILVFCSNQPAYVSALLLKANWSRQKWGESWNESGSSDWKQRNSWHAASWKTTVGSKHDS